MRNGIVPRAALAILALVAWTGGCSGEEKAESGGEPAGTVEEAAGSEASAAKPELLSVEPSADYPLKTCVISGEPLDGMGGPVAYRYGEVEVQFCCDDCAEEFLKDPETYLATVREGGK